MAWALHLKGEIKLILSFYCLLNIHLLPSECRNAQVLTAAIEEESEQLTFFLRFSLVLENSHI